MSFQYFVSVLSGNDYSGRGVLVKDRPFRMGLRQFGAILAGKERTGLRWLCYNGVHGEATESGP